MMLTQYVTPLGILDDTFDRYASLPEAESLANSLERWAPDHNMDKQPDYLKFMLNSILNTFEELERELRPEGRLYSLDATKDEFKKLAKANFDLAKWAQVAHVPSFMEYMEVGEVEITLGASLAGIFMCLGKIATKEAYEWPKSRPKLFKSLSIKARLRNDITDGAIRELTKIVSEADKTINEEFLTTVDVGPRVLKATIDFARMITVTYNVDEGFTHPEGKSKEYMTSLFLNQIRL
ncbi:unnamed protein product [Eruca vesicaria subsp. sativa]|uniref:Terpene synthase metal-binding domain-containing protein n=1 Tax=Eruca vesicaria subsp. sativa TaxID=29727 RepID=A0ABC8JIA4_ERUVS|nr:unnamed protein product [Eruca vesicaria subsp. sativa]